MVAEFHEDPQTTVRPAKPGDILPLCGLWRELMAVHATRDHRFALAEDAAERWIEQADETLARADAFLLVAECTGEPVGFCLGWIARNPPIYRSSEVGFISEIAVTEKMRGRGIGRSLLVAARRWFAARGIDEFQLSTAVWNEEAQGCWRAMGGQPFLIRYSFDVA